MENNLFAGIISSKTKIKLLVRLFFNPQTRSYLRELAKEFDVSTNSVREELNQLTKTQLLTAKKEGRQVNVEATIHLERDSQKGIVIGKRGSKLKQIGTRSREKIEQLLG